MCPLFLAAVPARAGTWLLAVSGSGSASAGKKSATLTLPASNTNTITIPALAANSQAINGASVTAKASENLVVTGTWYSSGAGDPAPTGVMLYEQSSASASGTVSNASGNSTTVVGTADDGIGDSTPDATGSVSGPHYNPEPVSGTVWTLPLSPNASVTATPSGVYACTASAGIGSITVSIHPQPYNLRLEGPPKQNADGSLTFDFDFSSTDGDLSDLSDKISCYESVTYNGNPGMYSDTGANGTQIYIPPNPPIDTIYNNPSTSDGGPPPIGVLEDTQQTPEFTMPYSATTYTGSQYYLFSDEDTGQVGVPIPGSVSYPISIVRQLSEQSTPDYLYTISKLGYENTLSLPLE